MTLTMLASSNDVTMVVGLLIAAAVLYFLEIVTPTFGVLIVCGLVAFVGSVVFAFRIETWVGLVILMGGILATPAYLYCLARILPNSPVGRRLFLQKAPSAENDATPQAETLHELIGSKGTAETTLRPSGVVKIGGRRLDAVAEHDLIEKGEAIEVIRAGGTDLVVRRLETT